MTSIYSKEIINILYGNKFTKASDVFEIYTWCTPFVFLTVASGKWFIAENMALMAFARNLLAAITSIMINYYGISNYGYISAAYAAIVSWLISGLIFDTLSHKTRTLLKIKIRSIFLFNIHKGTI